MAEGARLGHSARAALMTRGFAEMTRLAVAMGARPETLAGLSGLGDLSLTCNSAQSRNFALGRALGAGEARPGGTVEGVATARAACQLGARHGRRAADRRRRRRRARRRGHGRGRDGGAARPAAARGVRGGTMNHWLFKSEPETWGWDAPGRQGRRRPGMGRRPQLPGPQPHGGDEEGRPRLLLPLGREKAVVGVVEVIAEAHPELDRRGFALEMRRHPGRRAVPAAGHARDDQGRRRASPTWCWSGTPASRCSRCCPRNGRSSAPSAATADDAGDGGPRGPPSGRSLRRKAPSPSSSPRPASARSARRPR